MSTNSAIGIFYDGGADAALPPVRHLRIRFWGVQGSCPLFPEPFEVEEYQRTVARDVLARVMADLQARGGARGASVEQLLGGPITPKSIDAYQQRLGLAEVPVFGGETTCVSVETADDRVIILDGGSGIRNASKHLVNHWGNRPRSLNILATHEHLDHRSGLPFCQFCFARPGFDVTIHGTRPCLDAFDQRYGIFSRTVTSQMHYDDPVDFRVMAARFTAFEVRDPNPPANEDAAIAAAGTRPWAVVEPEQPIQIGATKVTPFDVYHGPTRCLAYKFEHGPVSFVFSTDHEVRRGTDPTDRRQVRSMAADERLARYCRGADLAYFDGQYYLEEYLGKKPIGVTAALSRLDWGHGCIEDVIRRSCEVGVKYTLVGHHDPERSWQARMQLDNDLCRDTSNGGDCKFELAKSGMVVDL